MGVLRSQRSAYIKGMLNLGAVSNVFIEHPCVLSSVLKTRMTHAGNKQLLNASPFGGGG